MLRDRQWAARGVAVLSLLSGTVVAEAARAEPEVACNAAATVLTVAPGSADTRQVTLAAGQRLDFIATADQGASVTVALVGGTGAPKTVLSGDTPASASFAAAEPGAYTFRLEASAPTAVSLRCTAQSTEANVRREFLTRRAERLMMDSPTYTRLGAKPQPMTETSPIPGKLDTDEEGRPQRMAFSMSLSELAAVGNPDARLAPPTLLDFWLEGRYEAYDTTLPGGTPGDGELGVVYLGTKYMLRPDIMVGALAQFDRAGEEASGEAPTLAASGWMAGPYVSARLGAGFQFDGRAAWGHANESLGGDVHTSGERQLLQARLSGSRQIEGWTFAPSLAFRYFEEAPGATPELSSEAAASGVGRVDLLPELSRRYQVNSDTFVEPRFAVGGFWAFDDLTHVPSAHAAAADVRLKAEAGVSVNVKEGTSLSATGGVEQGGEETENVWSGQVKLKMPLDQ